MTRSSAQYIFISLFHFLVRITDFALSTQRSLCDSIQGHTPLSIFSKKQAIKYFALNFELLYKGSVLLFKALTIPWLGVSSYTF